MKFKEKMSIAISLSLGFMFVVSNSTVPRMLANHYSQSLCLRNYPIN